MFQLPTEYVAINARGNQSHGNESLEEQVMLSQMNIPARPGPFQAHFKSRRAHDVFGKRVSTPV